MPRLRLGLAPLGQCRGRSARRRTAAPLTEHSGGDGRLLPRDVRAAQLAAILLGASTPDARVLVGGQGELEAGGLDRTGLADHSSLVDLHERLARGTDREEQIWTGVSAGSIFPPPIVGG